MKKMMSKVLVGTLVLSMATGIGVYSNNYVEAQGALTTTSKFISAAKAKKIALNHAKLSKTQVSYVKAELDSDNGTTVYEIEFYSGNKEYDYDIDARTGKIVSFDNDLDNYTLDENVISKAEAQKIACSHAGIKDTKVVYVKSQLEYDDGVAIYDIEFYSGNKEYDYEINAVTGKILEFDSEVEDFSISDVTTGKYISKTKARDIALNHAGLSISKVNGVKVKMEYDDNRMEFEVDFYSGSAEYEYQIDAVTGKILGYETDQDDDYDSDDNYNSDDDYNSNSSTYITTAKAKEIALNHAGLTSSKVYGMKVEFDSDDKEYEIQFKISNVEYEYKINAFTGKILDFDKEIDD